MEALIEGYNALVIWLRRLAKSFSKRAKKEAKKYKGKPPKPTAWEIIRNI